MDPRGKQAARACFLAPPLPCLRDLARVLYSCGALVSSRDNQEANVYILWGLLW